MCERLKVRPSCKVSCVISISYSNSIMRIGIKIVGLWPVVR